MQVQTYESTCDFEQIKLKYAIENGDALDVLSGMEKESVSLIITSTPYNIGKSYEIKTSIESYPNTQEEIISQLVRVLSDKVRQTHALLFRRCYQSWNRSPTGEIHAIPDVQRSCVLRRRGLQCHASRPK